MRRRGGSVSPLRPALAAAVVEDIAVRAPCKIALFTRHSLAAYLNVHVNTVDRLVARGELSAFRVAGKRRFYPEDVERYVRERREVS